MTSSQTIIENLILKPNSKLAQHIVNDAALLSAGVSFKKVAKARNEPTASSVKDKLEWNQRVDLKNAEKLKAKQAREDGQNGKNKNTDY